MDHATVLADASAADVTAGAMINGNANARDKVDHEDEGMVAMKLQSNRRKVLLTSLMNRCLTNFINKVVRAARRRTMS